MIRVFDFVCSGGHRSEHFVDRDTRDVTCPKCGEIATRQIATPRVSLDGCSGHFPTAADAWERRRASHMAKEQRNLANHDSYD